MYRRVFSLIIYRLALISLTLVYAISALILNLPIPTFRPLILVCASLTLVSLFYMGYLKTQTRREQRLSDFVAIQFAVDILCLSYLVYWTGGIESNLRFGYLVVILLAAVFLEKIAIYAITVLTLSFYYVALNLRSLILLEDWDYQSLVSVVGSLGEAMLGQFVMCFLTALVSAFMQTSYFSARQALSEREQNIRALRQIRRQIVESLTSGLITCTEDGRLNFVNGVGMRLLHKSKEELMGVDVWELLSLTPPGNEVGKTVNISRVERLYEGEHFRRTFGISYSSLETESGGRGFLFVFQDLTKIKLLEEQKRFADRMSALGKMAAGVAHEIRNPLAAISGSIQVLKEMIPPDAEAEELTVIIQAEAKRLDEIISQLLAYARPGLPPTLNPVDLVAAINHFVTLSKNDKHLKSLTCHVHFDGEDNVILGDVAKLHQVFWNLLRNSADACGADGRVEIHCQAQDNEVRLTITDNGIGMTQDQLKDLFTPFQSFKKAGTGLGMSIVYDIIQMHGGQIEVKSEVGTGTEVLMKFTRYKE